MERLSLLVADDDPSNREVARVILTTMGHAVTECHDGQQVIEACHTRAQRFDIIFLDIAMPRLDGLEVARRLRTHPLTSEVPIVCVSARASHDDRDQGMEAGCDFYVTKPYRRAQIQAVVHEILGLRERRL